MKWIICIFMLLYIMTAHAQNMVPNGDFEYYTVCPVSYGQVAYCTGWRQYHAGTPDYFNTCNTNPTSVSVPANSFGYQVPASGNAYMGGATCNLTTSYKEYITRSIIPLTIGVPYEVSVSVCMANRSAFSTNDFGVLFYDNGPNITLPGTNDDYLPVTPQVSFVSSGSVTDTANWIRLTATFTADSAYDNIIIGGFGDPVTTYQVPASGNLGGSYYYIDSIVVKPMLDLVNLYADSLICFGDAIVVPYAVTNPALFAPGNVFTAQLSNAAGSFSSGITTIGSVSSTASGSISCVVPLSVAPGTNYRIRVVSSSPAIISNINGKNITILSPVTTAATNTPVCEGGMLQLIGSSNTGALATFSWSGPNGFSNTSASVNLLSATPAMSGDYILTSSRLTKCVSKDTVTVIVLPLPQHSPIASNSPVCTGQTLTISGTSTNASTTYSWLQPDGQVIAGNTVSIPGVTMLAKGKYVITYNLNGCTKKDSVNITVNETPAPLTINTNTPVCEPEPVIVSCSNGQSAATFTWTGPNSFTFNGANINLQNTNSSMTGIYKVTASLNNGCFSYDSVKLIINPSPADIDITTNSPVCVGGMLSLNPGTGIANTTYTWSGPSDFKSNQQAPGVSITSKNQAGTYNLIATIGDCQKNASVNIEVLDPQLELGSSKTLCNDETLTLNIATHGGTYLWNDGNTSPGYAITKAGKYWVTTTTLCGTIADTINVNYEECECKPFVPTAFTPNNDGRNDNLTATINCNVSSYQFRIVNRFGQMVFTSSDPKQRWDGTFKGQPAEVGTYFYLLQFTGPRSKQYIFKGDITLIR